MKLKNNKEKCGIEDSDLFKYFSSFKEMIEKHKWYLSEKCGHDVGYDYALVDWMAKYASKDLSELKKKYKLQ